MKYFRIARGDGSSDKHLCERCAATCCVKASGYQVIHHRHPMERDLAEQMVGTWCDSCNAPLDTPREYKRKITSVRFALNGYSSAPLTFQRISRRQLTKLAKDVNDNTNDITATTEWSRAALDYDRKAADWAVKQAGKPGQPNRVLFTEDEDGFYFAVVEYGF